MTLEAASQSILAHEEHVKGHAERPNEFPRAHALRPALLEYETEAVDAIALDGRRVVLFANTDWYLYNFRLGLIERLTAAGAQVTLVSPPGEYATRLIELGHRHVPLQFDAGARGLISNLRLLSNVRQLIRDEKPDLVHCFTIKCVLFGGMIARLNRVPRVLAVTGLGHLFTDTRWTTRLLRSIVALPYKFALGGPASQVIFQNPGNREDFKQAGLIPDEGSLIIPGSGVDCTQFSPQLNNYTRHGPTRLLFASRLLEEKGIRELCEAVQVLIKRGVQVELTVAGTLYEGNPSSLTPEDVTTLSALPGIQFIGHIEQVNDLIHQSDVIVLPSYAEGCPRILIEAAAAGKPIVASDVPGCRIIVQHDKNGLLCEPRCTESLTAALSTIINRRADWPSLGRAGASIARQGFSEPTVNSRTLDAYEALLK